MVEVRGKIIEHTPEGMSNDEAAAMIFYMASKCGYETTTMKELVELYRSDNPEDHIGVDESIRLWLTRGLAKKLGYTGDTLEGIYSEYLESVRPRDIVDKATKPTEESDKIRAGSDARPTQASAPVRTFARQRLALVLTGLVAIYGYNKRANQLEGDSVASAIEASTNLLENNPELQHTIVHELDRHIRAMGERLSSKIHPYQVDTDSSWIHIMQDLECLRRPDYFWGFPESINKSFTESLNQSCRDQSAETKIYYVSSVSRPRMAIYVDKDNNDIYIQTGMPDRYRPDCQVIIKIDQNLNVSTLPEINTRRSVWSNSEEKAYLQYSIPVLDPEILERARALYTLIAEARTLQDQVNNYSATGVDSIALEERVRQNLIARILELRQTRYRVGSIEGSNEAFITRNMAERITDSLLYTCEILNINIVDFYDSFNRTIGNRELLYIAGREGTERGEIYSHAINGSIRVWGETDETLTYVLQHEFWHAILAQSYCLHQTIPTYREGLTEILTRTGDSIHGDINYDAYPESTLLTVAAGVWQQVVGNAQSERPVTVEELFRMPGIQEIVRQRWGAELDLESDEVQRIFIDPQTDEYVLPSYGRRRDSIDGLRSLVRRVGSWTAFKAQRREELIEIHTANEGDSMGISSQQLGNARRNIERHFNSLWRNE